MAGECRSYSQSRQAKTEAVSAGGIKAAFSEFRDSKAKPYPADFLRFVGIDYSWRDAGPTAVRKLRGEYRGDASRLAARLGHFCQRGSAHASPVCASPVSVFAGEP